MNVTGKIKFAVLTRVSTERQAERGHSLQAQMAQIERAVGMLGGTIVARYGNTAEHATRGFERKEFDRLLADVSKGGFDAVMVTDPSRWSRDNRRSKDGLDLLKKYRVRFFALTQEHDLFSPESNLALGILTEANGYYVERQLRSAAAGRIAGAKKGRAVVGGRLPWGRRFDRTSGEWSVNVECQQLAERMYDMYVHEHRSFRSIGEALLDPDTMVSMDENTVRRRLASAGSKWTQTINLDGRREEIECEIPPLLDADKVSQITRLADERRLVRNQPKYPLSNLVRCKQCGSVLSHHDVRSGNHTLPQYRHDIRVAHTPACTMFVYREPLEKDIFSRLGGILRNEESLRAAVLAGIANADSGRDETEKELAREVKELTRLKTASRNLLATIEASADAPVEYYERVNALGKQIKDCEARRSQLEAKLKLIELPQDIGVRVRAELDQLIGLNGHVVQHWPTEAKRKLVEFFFGGQSLRAKNTNVGILVEMRVDPDLGKYWVWEAQGLFGVIGGALSDYVYLQDRHFEEETQSVTIPPVLARALVEGTNTIHHAHTRAKS